MKSSFKKPLLYAFLLLFFGAGGYIFFSKPALSSVDQHKKWGVEFYEKRDFERAAVQFRAASRLAPQDLISFYYLALISLEQKEYQKAAAYAGQAIKIDPNSDDGYYYLGKALQGEKKYKEAIRAFSYSNKIKKFPGNYIQKGFCYLKLKKFKKAKKAFVRANKLTPSVSAYFGLARSNYFLRKNDLALENYRKASKLDNRKVWKNVIRKNIGFVYASLGNMKKASLFFGDEFVAGLRYEKVPEGIQVTEVNKGLPGEMAGVQLQDILIAADDQPLEGLDLKAISDLFDKKPRNSSIKLTVLREKKRKEIFLQKSMGPGAEGS